MGRFFRCWLASRKGSIIAETVRTCPSPQICRTATDNDTPGVAARRAFCRFQGWGMSKLFCNTTPLLTRVKGAKVGRQGCA